MRQKTEQYIFVCMYLKVRIVFVCRLLLPGAYPGFQRGRCLRLGPIRKVGGAIRFRSDTKSGGAVRLRRGGGGGGGGAVAYDEGGGQSAYDEGGQSTFGTQKIRYR